MANNRLLAGEVLTTALVSSNGRFTLVYQGDGNLVLYAGSEPLWDCGTHGQTCGQAILEGDGNIVVYDASGRAIWSSDTPGHPRTHLVLQDDGNLVLYAEDGSALWSSGTMVPPDGPGPRLSEHPPTDRRITPRPPSPGRGGGIVEHAAAPGERPRFTRADLATFIPERGAFDFPPPYGTRGIRLTNRDDGTILPVGYSYWPNVNNHAGRPDLYAFAGTAAGTPIVFRVDKSSGAVTPLGPMGVRGTGEGWYFSAHLPTALYLPEPDGGSRFLRYDVETRRIETVFAVEPEQCLWQMSSSEDDRAHAGTLRLRATGVDLGSVVYRGGHLRVYPKRDGYDECQIDKSGRYLVIKEGPAGKDNRIIDLEAGLERIVTRTDGALGHSDCGAGTMTGEDDGGHCWRMFTMNLAEPSVRRLDFHGPPAWGAGMGHVSVRGRRALLSSIDRDMGIVTLDGSLMIRIIAPNMVDASVGTAYDNMPKANLDPVGAFGCWSANGLTGARDVFLVEVPV